MNISIYFAWYTFYGQFVFMNEWIAYLLMISTDGHYYESPWKGTVHFDHDRVILDKWVFLLTGFWWDFIIFLIVKNLSKTSKIQTLDSV